MKKVILNLGKELTKNQQHQIKGGDPFTYCYSSEGIVIYDSDDGCFWLDPDEPTDGGYYFRRLSAEEVSKLC